MDMKSLFVCFSLLAFIPFFFFTFYLAYFPFYFHFPAQKFLLKIVFYYNATDIFLFVSFDGGKEYRWYKACKTEDHMARNKIKNKK